MDKISYFMSIIMGVKICVMYINHSGHPSTGRGVQDRGGRILGPAGCCSSSHFSERQGNNSENYRTRHPKSSSDLCGTQTQKIKMTLLYQ